MSECFFLNTVVLLLLLGSLAVRALYSGPIGREFDSRPVRYQVTILGKLLTIGACVGHVV